MDLLSIGISEFLVGEHARIKERFAKEVMAETLVVTPKIFEELLFHKWFEFERLN